MRRATRAAGLLGAAAVLGAAHLWPGLAHAAPAPRLAALVPVSAEPLGPAQPTEQRTHCARPAVLSTDPAADPPGHVLLDLGQAWRFSRGAGVTVAVIDTGVAPSPRLARLTGGGDYVSTGEGLSDCDLHGTVVAGIIAARPAAADAFAGVAPEASIVSIRQSSGAYDVSARSRSDDDAPSVGAGYGPLSTLAKAIVRAAESGATVINISETACLTSTSRFDDDAIASALHLARKRDVLVVAAAGNVTESGGCREQNPVAPASSPMAWSGVATVATPAHFGREILTVGAVDALTGLPAEFSLRGPWVTVAAPGTEIVSVTQGGKLIDALDGENGPRRLAGTSYAAAYVSGVAALVRARYPQLTADQVRERLIRTARGGSKDDPAVGAGVVDPVAALTADLPAAETLPDPRRGRDLATPPPDVVDHTAAVAVAATAAAGAAVVGAVVALTRRRT